MIKIIVLYFVLPAPAIGNVFGQAIKGPPIPQLTQKDAIMPFWQMETFPGT